MMDRLEPAVVSHGSSSYDDYDIKYTSVEMTVKDKDTFASLGFACQNSFREGSSFSLA